MRYRLCLMALTLTLGLAIVQPMAVLANDTRVEQPEQKPPKRRNGNMDKSYQEALDRWNKLSDAKKQEVYTILKNRQKADMELLNKLSQLGVISEAEKTAIQTGLESMYNQMIEKGEFPIMRPGRPEVKKR